MKYILYTFTIFSLIYLYSCGNDTTTNTGNGNGNETVIFSMDSLSINLNTTFSFNDTDITINNAPNVKITFNCSTNADSVNSYSLYRIIAGDSSAVYKDTLNNIIGTLNSDQTILINATTTYNLKIFIQISRNNLSSYFIRLKNIKIIKL